MAPRLCWESTVAMHLFLGGDVQGLNEDTADQVGHSTDVAVLLLHCHQHLLNLQRNGFDWLVCGLPVWQGLCCCMPLTSFPFPTSTVMT